MPRFLVILSRNPQFDTTQVEAHHEFLAALRDAGVLEMNGPFADGSGGAYLIQATDQASATDIAHADPLYTSGSSTLTIHEWQAH